MELRWHRSIDEFRAGEWNALLRDDDLPFLEWEWLHALEASGSLGRGWYPLHCALRSSGRLAAAAVFYAKTHSWGEFVYDHGWVQAAEAIKKPYYPKMVGVVPATPAQGYRFLTDEEEITTRILEAASRLCLANGFQGLHLLFTDPRLASRLEASGLRGWRHQHYLWRNQGFTDFADYLSGFTKNQRKNIRRERDRMAEQNLSLRLIAGQEAEESVFRDMFRYYSLTNDKFVPWDARFVNADFFELLGRHFRHRLWFVEASREGRRMALAMLVRKKDRLWGRYWGTEEAARDLHFNVCYYEPIEWCIREGISSFDPGIGSHHKTRRGFQAVCNTSHHLFFDPLMRALYDSNIAAVNAAESEIIDELNADLPLKDIPRQAGSSRRARAQIVEDD